MNAWKKSFIFPLRYYANCVSTTLTVSILHNVESVYFFYSNPVYSKHANQLHGHVSVKPKCGHAADMHTFKYIVVFSG
jgi:hypothetical protein